MKITVFGCKNTTLHFCRTLHKKGFTISLVTISPESGKKNNVAGYEDLTKWPDLFDEIYVAETYALKSDTDHQHFVDHSPNDVGFCIGWQRIIPSNVLEQFKFGVFGMHGSSKDLPYGRGRSPMNWSIIEGRKWFYTNLFRYLPGVDDGPILDTITFSIQPSDTAETLHYKNTLSMINLVLKNFESIISGTASLKKQPKVTPTYYSKRQAKDGTIDWSDDIYNIDRLIKAVAPPFYGAIGYIKGREIKLYRAEVFYTDAENNPFLSNDVGEIVDVFPNGKFLVRCSGGVLIVHDYDKGALKSLDPHTFFDHQPSPFLGFQRNDHGFFDI